MATTIYGIKNCDTMKKAMKWLDEQGVDYHFHDYRKDGVPEDHLRQWMAELGWDTVINRRGTTWRKLDPEVRENMDTDSAADQLVQVLTQLDLARAVAAREAASVRAAFSWDNAAAAICALVFEADGDISRPSEDADRDVPVPLPATPPRLTTGSSRRHLHRVVG